ncbi:MAG: PQQ-binding-like beta-propeller repeat protein [Candidatus Aenigmarchaeota archaeon]|nr:PQQ-binding-like beta-propeller repeat protein [Candidatus Aenigmarchaeota archaeon]
MGKRNIDRDRVVITFALVLIVAIILLVPLNSMTGNIIGNSIETRIPMITNTSNTTSTSEWTMFGRILDNTRYYPDTVNLDNFGKLWGAGLNGLGTKGQFTIANGIVYIGDTGSLFYALNATNGNKIWNYSTGVVYGGAAIADGIAYVGGNKLYALNATNGSQIWSYTVVSSIITSPTVVDGIVYVPSQSNHWSVVTAYFYAINATDGTQVWNYSIEQASGAIYGSAPAVVNGIVYIGTKNDYEFLALNATDGTQVWNYSLGDYYVVKSSPAVAYDMVYFGSYSGIVDDPDYFYALNATDGTHVWNYSVGDSIWSSPAVRDGVVYVGCNNQKLYAFNATNGSLIWSYTAGNDIASSPVVTDNWIFVGGRDDKLHVINISNSSDYSTYDLAISLTTSVLSSPAIADGVVYIGWLGEDTNDQSIFAISGDSDPATSLNSPSDGYSNYTNTSVPVTFNCSATDDNGLVNISLYITNTSNESFSLNQTTNISGTSNSTAWDLNLTPGYYRWNCISYDSGGYSDWGDSNRSLTTIQDASPATSLNSPSDNYVNTTLTTTNITFNCSATDDKNLVNISLYITNTTNQSFSLSQTTNISGTSNSTAWNLTLSPGNYTWNCISSDNSSQSDWGDSNRSIAISTVTFNFYGYTKFPNGTAMNGTNVTIEIYEMVPGEGATLNSSYSTLSNTSGFFNISGIIVYESRFYKPVIMHYNDSSNIYVDYIGASLPEFPYFEINAVIPVNFYLKEAATINISAVNATGQPKAFRYQLKDTKLGYSISSEFQNLVTNKVFYVPADRNYSVMIYPNQSLPVSVDITNPPSYYNKTFNCTQSVEPLSGYITASGISGFDSLFALPYTLEPGRMIYIGGESPSVMSNFTGTDLYNTTSGFYNISVVAPKESASIILFIVGQNDSDYYGGFKEVALNYGVTPSETNMTLYKLLGNSSNISSWGLEGQTKNILLKEMTFRLFNSSNTSITGFAHVEIELDYDDFNMTNFTFMTDVSQTSNGTFTVPILNMTGIKRINIFTPSAAPTKRKYTATQVNTLEGINITMKAMFNMEDPDGDILGNLFIDMIKHSGACNVPNYNSSSCSLFAGGESSRGGVHPLSVVMSGAPMSFRMRNANNITVHYVNVDMLASGPPDALFDSDSTDTNDTSTFAQAWRFGSSGPEIYDYVIIGIPYTEGSNTTVGFNESLDINMSIPQLYDDDWNAMWNSSAGDNLTNISTDTALEDFADYLNTTYEVYFNGTNITCNASDVNLSSGVCYADISNNMIWFKIKHFSGVGPEPTGTVTEIATDDTTDDTTPASGGGGGGGAGAAATEETEEEAEGETDDTTTTEKNPWDLETGDKVTKSTGTIGEIIGSVETDMDWGFVYVGDEAIAVTPKYLKVTNEKVKDVAKDMYNYASQAETAAAETMLSGALGAVSGLISNFAQAVGVVESVEEINAGVQKAINEEDVTDVYINSADRALRSGLSAIENKNLLEQYFTSSDAVNLESDSVVSYVSVNGKAEIVVETKQGEVYILRW